MCVELLSASFNRQVEGRNETLTGNFKRADKCVFYCERGKVINLTPLQNTWFVQYIHSLAFQEFFFHPALFNLITNEFLGFTWKFDDLCRYCLPLLRGFDEIVHWSNDNHRLNNNERGNNEGSYGFSCTLF